jgi:hypothetical protein
MMSRRKCRSVSDGIGSSSQYTRLCMKTVSLHPITPDNNKILLPDADYVLRAPRVMSYQPDHNERIKVALYIKQIVGGRHTIILANLPTVMSLWKKVRIRHGGDSIWTNSATRISAKQRNASYIRVSLLYHTTLDPNLII